jgi:two-component system, OmpR family, response regulator MtrA
VSAAPRVLVIDDDRRLRHLVQVILEGDGFVVHQDDDGARLLPMVRQVQPDVVLLDLAMSHVSGMQALSALRAAGEEVPVVMLSATFEQDAMVSALNAGADDYITKPFLPRVLAARLRAVVRRARMRGGKIEGAGDLTLDPETLEAALDGRRIGLSPTEFELLRTLVRGRGRTFATDELLRLVWGEGYVGSDEIVRANIYRLRQKLEPRPHEPRYILGRRGVGYRLEP